MTQSGAKPPPAKPLRPARDAACCVVCGFVPASGVTLVPIRVAGRVRKVCAFHAVIADRAAPATLAELRRVSAAADRRSSDRRAGEDRRAFWRPTPDRRAEATDPGRRTLELTDVLAG